MKSNKYLIWKRLISFLVVLFSIYIFPWQISLILLVVVSAINKKYLETILLGGIMDSVYTSYLFENYPVPFLTFSIIIYWVISFLQTRSFKSDL